MVTLDNSAFCFHNSHQGSVFIYCRHWQELGYLILYVTARPDLQHRKVVAWLAQHNFPHGMVAFMDGFSKEPIKQKMYYLKSLMTEVGFLAIFMLFYSNRCRFLIRKYWSLILILIYICVYSETCPSEHPMNADTSVPDRVF